jgi:hypothetical protein
MKTLINYQLFMKKALSLIFMASASMYLFAQSFVVTTPQEKNVILEQFTGINCTFCPDGHVRAKALADSKPGRVVIAMFHEGNFANTTPDYRTAFGTPLSLEFGVSGYPAGAVNREVFPEIGTSVSMGRGAWAYAAYQKFPEQSPVNIGVQTSFNETTRELTVDVELYYTKNSPQATNYIQLAFLQDSIKGPQTSGGAGSNYNHMHMFRHFLTGQWGDAVTTTSQGTSVQRSYTWTVPDSIGNGTSVKIPVVIENCHIAAYVTESRRVAYTAVQVPAINGMHTGETALYTGEITGPTQIIQSGTPSQNNTFNLQANSSLAGTEDFKVYIRTENMPASWAANFVHNATNYSDSAVVSITNGAPQNITVNVTPSVDAGLAKIIVRMVSVNNPEASPKEFEMYVMSGITDLIVRGSGSWGDGLEYNFDQVLNDAMIATGCVTWANTNADIMKKAFDANIMAGVKNIYLNIAWTFPSLSDDEATALMAFMNGGGNVFMSGQDIAWDINASGGYGTVTTKNFFRNYIRARYVDDGNSSNSQLVPISEGYPFANVESSAISPVYGNTHIYPDQIDTINGSVHIFTYNIATRKAGIRFENETYKVVYLGVGLEMIGDVAKRNDIFKITYDWFNGAYSNISENALQSLFLGHNYPNPANESTFIPVNNTENTNLELFDALGKLVYSAEIPANTLVYELNTTQFKPGQYIYRIVNNKGMSKTQNMIIAR